MLAIRMQRTGRKGHAMFRVIVQEARLTPTSGKVVAQLGHYDPHAKSITIDKDKAAFYLKNGAQPSERAAKILQSEGVKLPKWVSIAENKSAQLRNPDKLRKNQPKEEKAEAVAEAAPEEEKAPAEATEQPAESKPATDEEETPTES